MLNNTKNEIADFFFNNYGEIIDASIPSTSTLYMDTKIVKLFTILEVIICILVFIHIFTAEKMNLFLLGLGGFLGIFFFIGSLLLSIQKNYTYFTETKLVYAKSTDRFPSFKKFERIEIYFNDIETTKPHKAGFTLLLYSGTTFKIYIPPKINTEFHSQLKQKLEQSIVKNPFF